MSILASCTILLLAVGSISAETKLSCTAKCDYALLGPIGQLLKAVVDILIAVLRLLADLLNLDVLCDLGQNLSDLICVIVSIVCGDRTDLIDTLFTLVESSLGGVQALLEDGACTGCLRNTLLSIKSNLHKLSGFKGLPQAQLIPQLIAGIGKLLVAILHVLLCALPALIKIILTMLSELLTKCDLDAGLASCNPHGILTNALSILAIPLNTIAALLGLLLG